MAVANESPSLNVDRYGWTEWQHLAATWSNLVTRCPGATFFVTREWIESWLDEFGPTLQPSFLIFRGSAGEVVGACALVKRSVRKGPFTIHRIYLNTSGEDEPDRPCIEFNTLLCVPGAERSVAEALRHTLERSDAVDEFVADGIVAGPARDALRAVFASCVEEDSPKPSYYIDLEELRASRKDFVDTLTSKERVHVRQSLRKYSELGDLQLDSASDPEQALRFLDELAVLHQRSWEQRGFPGSFASSRFVRFHRNLIARCFAAGQVQLLRVRAGSTTIGAAYNFVFRGKLYFYQCGYDYGHGKRLSPGMVVQALAIRHAAEIGLKEYDLMAGDVEYKKKLAKQCRSLHWETWRIPGVKMKAFELLRRTKRSLESGSLARYLQAAKGT